MSLFFGGLTQGMSMASLEEHCRQRTQGVPFETRTGEPCLLARVWGQYPMFVARNDTAVSMRLLIDGYWEMDVTAAIARFFVGFRQSKPKGADALQERSMIDVGANVGYFSLLGARYLPEVHALEPQAELVELMKMSDHAMFGLPRVFPQRLGAGARHGTLGVLVGAKGLGDTRLVPSTYKPGESIDVGGRREVPPPASFLESDVAVVPLDALKTERPPLLIKVDVEGMEPEVLLGARGLLTRTEDLRLVLEWTPRAYVDPERVLNDLRSTGFVVQEIIGGGLLREPQLEPLAKGGYAMLWCRRGAPVAGGY